MMKDIFKAKFSDMAVRAAESAKRLASGRSGAQARRFGFLCISVLLSLNIVTAMMPFTPAAVAEAGTALPAGTIEVSTFEQLQAALEQNSVPEGEVSIALTQNIECLENLRPLTGRAYTIYGQGHTLSRAASFTKGPSGSEVVLGSMLLIGETASVTLDNVIVSSKDVRAEGSPLVILSDSGVLNLRNESKLCDSRPLRNSSLNADYGAVYMAGGTLDGGLNPSAASDANGTRNVCAISDCAAEGGGGGVFMTGGTVSNLYIKNCTAKNGGGIYLGEDSENPGGGIISNCIVENCVAASAGTDGGGLGGGIMATAGSMNNVHVRSCTASNYGGGIAVFKNSGVNIGGRIVVSNCGETAAANGTKPGYLRGESFYIDGSISTGYNHLSFPGTDPASVDVPDCYVKTVYSQGKYQNNRLADQNNFIVYTPLASSTSDDNAVKAAETAAGLSGREFAGVFAPADKAALKNDLQYTIHLTDGTIHQPSSGSSAETTRSSSLDTTTSSPYCNKKLMLYLYDITDDGAAVRDTVAVRADPYGDIDIPMDFAKDSTGKVAAVLYEYPDCCKIGSVKYPDLEDAIRAAKAGETITLLRDTEVSHTLDIGSNKNNLIFDGGNDHYSIFRANGFKDAVFNVGDRINTTFKNLDISGKTYSSRFTPPGDGDPNPVSAPLISCSGILNLDNCNLYDNCNTSKSTDTGATPGGGVYLNGGKLIASNGSTIAYNSAENGGGICTVKSGTGANALSLEINGIKVTGNHADSNGGGIFADEDAILKDIIVQQNTADKKGGGVYAVKNTAVGGELQINNNTSGTGSHAEPSDYYLQVNTSNMTVTSPLASSSIIGVRNYKESSVIAKADGTNVTSLKGRDKCFFPDVDSARSGYYFELDNTTGQNIFCRNKSESSALYKVSASTEDSNGKIAPSSEMLLHAGNHDFTITPDDGYIIDTVSVTQGSSSKVDLYKNDQPVSGNDNGSVTIKDGVGTLSCNIKGDTAITASFKKAAGEFTCTAKTQGGNSACGASAEKNKVKQGESDTITFTTGNNNLAYALTDIKVGSTSIKTNGGKLSNYLEDVQIGSDSSLNYTYKLNDIRSNKEVTGVFSEVYSQADKTDADSKITIHGSYIGNDAQIIVEKLPTSDKCYNIVKDKLDNDHMIAKTGTGDDDIALYDVSLVSDTLDYPYRSSLSIKFFAGTDHIGQEAYAYHITDADKGEVDTSLKATVGNDGYFVIATNSLSPYAIVVPKQSGSSANSSNSSNNSTITTVSTTTAAPAAATPSSSATANNNVTVQTTGTPHTGDKLPPFVIPLLIGSAVIVIISGVSLFARKKKKDK